ncbi:hypothetical protein [Tenacibaculum maritimum]|uniref:Uncharacterized protein n=1 Tax=Tenacibaculum maritimum NCIMB 2154 TaxID=1349785 RepID=A0A2H1E7J2_9FLAO|nr:hypothetical protein [Tenacibaculum maritimum]SFZ80442.1 conserved protein of unknown function [Tenacibaculum maritimum NCIMB 2154]CAA0168267.1 conserved hypothetical protein [Tenacibaculum maritimum]CAA0172521.1 conserved hypothetical protein [Tenacibaculum maritimum]CAA0179618.1 conserved hypothetical protein [Tenacibaculum maritimum]CAA0186150.1 conserved hypothetical protein [Tenacibaculum maritimum]
MIKGIITDCLDLLAGIENLKPKEQKGTLQNIIDVLGSYPKPKKELKNKDILACYLFVSNARNACKLSVLEYMSLKEGFNIIHVNLENTLSLLVDELKAVR